MTTSLFLAATGRWLPHGSGALVLLALCAVVVVWAIVTLLRRSHRPRGPSAPMPG
jgi:hypothetical protein